MCWTSYKNPIMRTAKKDIPIFKIMTKDLISRYYCFAYELNTEYRSWLDYPEKSYNTNSSKYFINRGFHSYNPKCTVRKSFRNKTIKICSKQIFNYTLLAAEPYGVVKVEGIIPKDANYYLNEFGEYVSDRIKLTKIVEI